MLGPLTMLAMLATAPAPRLDASAVGSATLQTACPAAAAIRAVSTIPWAERYRREIRQPGPGRHSARQLAAGLGAALAWEAADLPRHQIPGILPRGDFEPGALFAAPLWAGPGFAGRPDGAIGAMIERWNSLYPPYALEGMGDR